MLDRRAQAVDDRACGADCRAGGREDCRERDVSPVGESSSSCDAEKGGSGMETHHVALQVNKEDSRFRHLMAAQLNAAAGENFPASIPSPQVVAQNEEVREGTVQQQEVKA